MRISFKRLLFGFIGATILFNLYIFYRFYLQQNHSWNNFDDEHRHQRFRRVNQKNQNEFLVLDWTANQHIFKEQDPIQCDFSHITPEYCRSKFTSIMNNSLRLHLIQRCSRLSTIIIHWTADRSRLNQADLLAYHSIHMSSHNLPKLIRNNQQQQFSTVYILESEVHSIHGQYWHEIDFPMWYNLERSYPEPVTYFDLQIYLKELFAPIDIPYSKKRTTAPIVWISSNCDAYNGRHLFIQQLMSYIHIDSYGKCLNNIKSNDINAHKQSNSVIYASYKFVIAIENSNCEDYITEKLVEAFSSTSVPIIASRERKPDYKRFAPEYSFINVYDYKSMKELADYLNYLSENETAYHEYLWFRQPTTKNYTSTHVLKQSLTEYLHLADEILGVNSTIRKWLLTKETSRNKYCKLAQFIYTNDWEFIYQRKKIDRPTAEEVCLPRSDLALYFSK